MFNKKVTELFQGIGEAKKAVLSTSSNNRKLIIKKEI